MFNGNIFKLEIPKGDINTGYIIMIVYYVLHNYGIQRSKEDITIVFPESKGQLSKLPLVERNLKKIFNNTEYSLNTTQTKMCGFENLLDDNIKNRILIVKKDLVDSQKFQEPIHNVQIASIIYYVLKKKEYF